MLVGRSARDLVRSWAKRGEEPISRQEFRLHVRKLIEQHSSSSTASAQQTKHIDALFVEFDEVANAFLGDDGKNALYGALAAILHLGDITFKAQDAGEVKAAETDAPGHAALELAAQLLKYPPNGA